MRKQKLRMDEPRQQATFVYSCYASPELFKPRWDDLSLEAKDEVEKNGSLPCDGGGVPGE